MRHAIGPQRLGSSPGDLLGRQRRQLLCLVSVGGTSATSIVFFLALSAPTDDPLTPPKILWTSRRWDVELLGVNQASQFLPDNALSILDLATSGLTMTAESSMRIQVLSRRGMDLRYQFIDWQLPRGSELSSTIWRAVYVLEKSGMLIGQVLSLILYSCSAMSSNGSSTGAGGSRSCCRRGSPRFRS